MLGYLAYKWELRVGKLTAQAGAFGVSMLELLSFLREGRWRRRCPDSRPSTVLASLSTGCRAQLQAVLVGWCVQPISAHRLPTWGCSAPSQAGSDEPGNRFCPRGGPWPLRGFAVPLKLSRLHQMAYVFKAISLRRGAQASATPLLLSIDSSIEAVCHPPSGWLGRGYSVCLHPQKESVLPRPHFP